MANKIIVQQTPITIISEDSKDYISLTDMAGAKQDGLSALCGIVNASIGVACGIVYLHESEMGTGKGFEHMCFAIKNMINTLAGMVCDGAKPSCALKMSTGIYSAFTCAELAYHGRVVDATDGLSETDVDCSIRNLGRLGFQGMNDADDTILDIMTHKGL